MTNQIYACASCLSFSLYGKDKPILIPWYDRKYFKFKIGDGKELTLSKINVCSDVCGIKEIPGLPTHIYIPWTKKYTVC